MSGVHKHPTISFRVSDREREMIEAKILASGMQKKDYFVRSCIYNRICVVGKKEVIYQLVEELQNMQTNLSELVKQLGQLLLRGWKICEMTVWICYRRLLQCWMVQSISGREYRLIKKKVLTAATVRTCGNKRKPLLHL